MKQCYCCRKEVEEPYVTFVNGEVVSGHKHCIYGYSNNKAISMHPFADEEEIDRLREERDRLIVSLENYNIPQDEKRFVIRKLRHITEKMVEKARYAKSPK